MASLYVAPWSFSSSPCKRLRTQKLRLNNVLTIGLSLPISGYAFRNWAMYVMIDFSSGFCTSTSASIDKHLKSRILHYYLGIGIPLLWARISLLKSLLWAQINLWLQFPLSLITVIWAMRHASHSFPKKFMMVIASLAEYHLQSARGFIHMGVVLQRCWAHCLY